jgi:hypothetical protein
MKNGTQKLPFETENKLRSFYPAGFFQPLSIALDESTLGLGLCAAEHGGSWR